MEQGGSHHSVGQERGKLALFLLPLAWAVAIFLVPLISAQAASAQAVESILHSFGDKTVPNDGNSPNDLILGTDGALYGTTAQGGEFGNGAVFRFAGGKVTIIHSFGATANDGTGPISLVQAGDGSLYGSTDAGGSAKQGAIFKLTPDSSSPDGTGYRYSLLHSFGDHSVSHDGYKPGSLVVGSDGNLYGITGLGGAADQGIVFKISTSGAETILHAFADGTVANDGTVPTWFTLGSSKTLYGVASGGGEYGAIFKITLTPMEGGGIAYSYSIFHSFQFNTVANNGIFPNYLTVGTDGALYGTKEFTGVDSPNMMAGGTLYKLAGDGTETLLHKFGDGTTPNDGSSPRAVLQGSNGRLYGVTMKGGAAGFGTVYMYSNGAETILHSFGDGSVANDGQGPFRLLQAKDGNLYGITEEGGSAGQGTIFKLTISRAGISR